MNGYISGISKSGETPYGLNNLVAHSRVGSNIHGSINSDSKKL